MTTTTRVFEPNAVLIPEKAIDTRSNGDVHADPDECTLLYLDGDRLSGDLYSKDGWLGFGRPMFVLRDNHYYHPYGTEPFCRAGLSIRDQEPVPYPRIQLLPDMWVLKRDETEYWGGLEEKRIQRVFGVYVLNKRKEIHLCEITPSYELHKFDSQWEQGWSVDDPQYDALNDAAWEHVQKGDSEDDERVTYIHVSDVEKMLVNVLSVHAGDLPEEPKACGGYRCDALKSVTEEDALEEIREATRNGDL